MNKIETNRPVPIEQDFALWAAEQAALLRAGQLDRIDNENLAEEIESVGNSERYAIDSRMEVLLQHLLKWEFQPGHRSNSWKATIREQRVRIARAIRYSPSLHDYPAENLDGSFIIGRNSAITETRLPESAFPATCPYSIEQILDPESCPAANRPVHVRLERMHGVIPAKTGISALPVTPVQQKQRFPLSRE